MYFSRTVGEDKRKFAGANQPRVGKPEFLLFSKSRWAQIPCSWSSSEGIAGVQGSVEDEGGKGGWDD